MNKEHGKLLLVVVAKAPVPGEVKTRLYPKLTIDEATDLYRCFLQDRIKEIGRLTEIDLAISYTPEESKEYFSRFITNGFHLFPQRGKNLGERLSNIFKDKLADEYDAVSIIDSDTPDLPRSIVQQSFQLLMSNGVDAVFGPCDDGGYYLVAMRRPQPDLFQHIPWSTEAVLAATLERANAIGLKAVLLPRWNDLDTFEDLIEFYNRHRHQLSEKNWAGQRTLNYLSRIESIAQRFA
ncbi:TIGR04282 family arsenosugar biosynthesis glycosyltransferase [bacterium]|nr:TIGR04282 family arsenosugar biosynthesis glycosyltransferase [bacterium]